MKQVKPGTAPQGGFRMAKQRQGNVDDQGNEAAMPQICKGIAPA